MASAKTTTSTFRIKSGLKGTLRAVAAREHHGIANIMEVLIRDYCERNGIVISEQGGPI